MPILTMPTTPRFAEPSLFRLLTNSLGHTSQLDRSTQSVELIGAHWAADYVLPLMEEAQGVDWAVFLEELDGTTGRFYGHHPYHIAPRGSAKDTPGTPVVAGADQSGKSIDLSGLPVSATGYLLRGDFWSVDLPTGSRSLHRVTADVDSDAGGLATLTFRPALRESPADLSAIHLSPATCTMMLIDDNQAIDQVSNVGHYNHGFSAIEAFTL